MQRSRDRNTACQNDTIRGDGPPLHFPGYESGIRRLSRAIT